MAMPATGPDPVSAPDTSSTTSAGWRALVDDAPPVDSEWEEWASRQLDAVGGAAGQVTHSYDRAGERD
jgi:hypothetical protein